MTAVAEHINRPEWAQFHRHHNLICQRCWFKQAEIETRNLLKKLDTLEHDMGFEDRPVLDKAKARLEKVHDDLLKGLMEGKNP